ncbi:dihydrofolate reductase family protein [Actinoplanes sp. NPDC004185]
MRRLTYYIAVSLDGFIAGPGGEFDFFAFEGDFAAAVLADFPETLPGPARVPLGIGDAPNKRFDAVVMGRGTYEPGLAAGMTSPYPHLRQYVFSRTLAGVDPGVEIVAGDPVEVVRRLKEEDGLGIWLCGGGRLAGQLRDEIDELILKINPVVLGRGIPLFADGFRPARLRLVQTRVFETGTIMATYARP